MKSSSPSTAQNRPNLRAIRDIIEHLTRKYDRWRVWPDFIEISFQDILGRLYMQLELGNKRQGQFFTPYEVSRLKSC